MMARRAAGVLCRFGSLRGGRSLLGSPETRPRRLAARHRQHAAWRSPSGRTIRAAACRLSGRQPHRGPRPRVRRSGVSRRFSKRGSRKRGFDYEVINAGVSGDTSAGGLRRLDWSLQGDVRVLIVALGANDGLRGLPPSELQANLETIVSTAQKRAGASPAAGHGSAAEFRRRLHARVPRRVSRGGRGSRRALSRSSSRGSPASGELNQADGIHPTAEGQRRIAETIWRTLESMVTVTDVMIDLRGVSRTVQSGSAPLTILHPLDFFVSRRTVGRHHRPLGQRQVDAAGPDRGPGRAVHRHRF